MQGWTSCTMVLPCTSSFLHHPQPSPRPWDIARGCLPLTDGAGEVRGIPPPPPAMSWHGDPQGKREVEGKCLCLRKSITYFSSPQLQTSLQITQLQHRQSSRTKSQAERRDSCWVFTPASPAGSLGRGGGDGGRAKFGSYKFRSGPLHSFPWQHRRELHVQPSRKRFCK